MYLARLFKLKIIIIKYLTVQKLTKNNNHSFLNLNLEIYEVIRFKIQYAFIRQEHNIIYNHMNVNNIRLETSTKEQKEPLS